MICNHLLMMMKFILIKLSFDEHPRWGTENSASVLLALTAILSFGSLTQGSI